MAKRYIETFKELSGIAELKNAFISLAVPNHDVHISSVWSHRNIANNSRTLMTNEYLFDSLTIRKFMPTPRNSDIILSATHNGKSAYMIQERDKTYLLLNYENGKSSVINIGELDLHGKIYTNENVSFCWSRDGSHIAYIAEKKRPKPTSFFTIIPEEKEKKPDGKGEENRFVDDWGEQLNGQHIGTIGIVNVKDLSLKVIDIPKNYLVGDVCWSVDGKSMFGIAYIEEAYRLGLIYCPIRENIIFTIDMEGNFRKLNSSDETKYSYQNLHLSPDGKSLAFLRNLTGGTHVRSAQLCVLDVQTEEVRVIIDYVDVNIKDSNGNLFYGLDGWSNLAENCWCCDNKRILISTYSYYESAILLVDTETLMFSLLPSDYSQKVWDVKEDYVLISRSSLLKPTQLFIGYASGKTALQIEFIPVSVDTEIEADSVKICRRVCEGVSHPGSASDLPVPYMYLGPMGRNNSHLKRPLLVIIHGGPHSAILNSFYFQVFFFLKLGYSILLPNYRGSLGQGRRSIESLPGYCGTADVTDVYACIQQCLSEFGDNLDQERINLIGGSHGGFLVTQIAGQYPNLMHKVVSRNPVIDLSSMQLTTDIPDWTFVETGVPYKLGKLFNTKDSAKMFEMSPLSHIDKVKAPIMLQLGKNDRRVPYMQGLLYHKMLLARGIETEAFIYDDCHSLIKVDVEADCMIHAARWLGSED